MKLPTLQPVDPRVIVDNVIFEQGELDNVGDLLQISIAPRLWWESLRPNGLLGRKLFGTVSNGLKTFHGKVPLGEGQGYRRR